MTNSYLSSQLISFGVIIVFLVGLVIGLNYQKQSPVDIRPSQLKDQPQVTDQPDGRPTSAEGNQREELTRQFPVKHDDRLIVDLKSVYQINVTGQDTDTLSFSITGPQNLVDRLTIEPRDGRVVFEEIVDQQLNISVQEGVSGQITLPTSIALTLKVSGAGEIKMTDHRGQVTIVSDGSTKVEFINSESRDSNLELSGSSQVVFDRCRGNLEIVTSDAAHFAANHCTIKQLKAEARGASNIKIKDGSTEQANLEASDASNIKVPSVSKKLDQHSSGASSIDVR